MRIILDLSNILEVIATVVSYQCEKINLKSGKFSNIITKILKFFSFFYLLIGTLTLDNYLIIMILRFWQRNWMGICLYIIFFALIPPAVAFWERKKEDSKIKPSYVKGNLIYNLLGAGSACAMIWVSCNIIGDFFCLIEFHAEGIVSILISACVWLVFAYQRIEQHKDLPDHSADTKWLNQKLNMFHLFNAFFFSTISVVFIVCYSIYCYIHNLQLTIQPNYFLALTIMLLFFYSLSQHFHQHVYMVFVVMVPVILVSSVYWMSWFSMSNMMRCVQWIFIVMHSLLYAFLIFYRNKMFYIGKREEMENGRYEKTHKLGRNWVWAIEGGGFQMILLAIVIVCYSVSWIVPMLTKRIEGYWAENVIIILCENTDAKVDEMIALAKEKSAYDVVNQDYDKGKYLKFVYDELYLQILDQGIINADSTYLTYDALQGWYNRYTSIQ